MNNKRVRTKAMAMAVAAAMAVELCPVTAFAVTGDQVAADGTYTSTAQVNRDPVADVDDDWADYGVSVELTVKDGKFENITVTPDTAYSSGNDSYFNKAYNKSKGIKTLLEGQPATEATINGWKIGADGVSGATRTATAVKQAALAAIQSVAEKQDPTPVEVKTDGLQASITALVAAQAQAGNLSSSLQPLASVTNEGSVQLPTLDTNALTQTITQISTAYESIESSFAKLSTKLPEIQKQLDQLSNIKLPENAMSQLKDNVDKINAGMKVLDQGLTTVSKNMGLLDKSTDSLSTAAYGINTLLGGFKQLNGYNQTLLDGASKLKANSPSLVAGINTLAGGTDELASGLNTLGSQLCSGSEHSQQTVLHFETVLPHSFPEQQSFPKAEPYCKMEVSR